MASYDGTAITTAELQAVLSSLKAQKESINNTYKTMIKTVLESSSSCFAVSGLDYTTILSVFESTFTTLDSNFDALIDVLENGVIRTYSELAIAIRKMFSDDFAYQMAELMGLNSSIIG